MKQQLLDSKYDFISDADKAFILAFDEAMREIGYESGGIGTGFCWGRYMLVYAKAGVKSKKVAARIYIRETGLVLRLFLNGIDKHKQYIESAPEFIKLPFTGDHGNCQHCHNEKDGSCKFRKTYALENRFFEKCNGFTFEYEQPNTDKLPDYMALLKEFYPVKKGGKQYVI